MKASFIPCCAVLFGSAAFLALAQTGPYNPEAWPPTIDGSSGNPGGKVIGQARAAAVGGGPLEACPTPWTPTAAPAARAGKAPTSLASGVRFLLGFPQGVTTRLRLLRCPDARS